MSIDYVPTIRADLDIDYSDSDEDFLSVRVDNILSLDYFCDVCVRNGGFISRFITDTFKSIFTCMDYSLQEKICPMLRKVQDKRSSDAVFPLTTEYVSFLHTYNGRQFKFMLGCCYAMKKVVDVEYTLQVYEVSARGRAYELCPSLKSISGNSLDVYTRLKVDNLVGGMRVDVNFHYAVSGSSDTFTTLIKVYSKANPSLNKITAAMKIGIELPFDDTGCILTRVMPDRDTLHLFGIRKLSTDLFELCGITYIVYHTESGSLSQFADGAKKPDTLYRLYDSTEGTLYQTTVQKFGYCCTYKGLFMSDAKPFNVIAVCMIPTRYVNYIETVNETYYAKVMTVTMMSDRRIEYNMFQVPYWMLSAFIKGDAEVVAVEQQPVSKSAIEDFVGVWQSYVKKYEIVDQSVEISRLVKLFDNSDVSYLTNKISDEFLK